MDINSKIYIAGHRGLVGTALYKSLRLKGCRNLIVRTSGELNLTDQGAAREFIRSEKPEYIVLVAANHGGIQANQRRKAEFLYDNMMINFNIIHSAWECGAKKLINIGASCVYPEEYGAEYREELFLKGPVQEATEGYAWAKAMGMKYCQFLNTQSQTRFVSLLPVNLYGENVSFEGDEISVIPAMLRRFHEAKTRGMDHVAIWGNGEARREFLHVSDLVRGILLLLDEDGPYDLYNIGSGEMISIQGLAKLCARITGYRGEIRHDLTKPGGASRQKLDTSRMKELGWKPEISLSAGLSDLYRYASEHQLFV